MSENRKEPEPDAPDSEAGLLEELLATIPVMDHQLTDLQEAVEGLVDELTNYPAGGPWLWDGLSPKAQRELWVELDAFVSWLQNRILSHHMAKEGWIAPCWYRHPDAVEQLTALMVAHKASYHPKSMKPSHSLVDWFHRCLWPTMDTLKLRQTFKECLSKKKHEEPYMLGLNLEVCTAEFTAFVDANVPKKPAIKVDEGTGEILDPATDETPPAPMRE